MKGVGSIGACKGKDAANKIAAMVLAEGRTDVWIEIPHLNPEWVNAHLISDYFWVNYTHEETSDDS